MREETEKQPRQAFRGVVTFESDRSGVTVLLSHVCNSPRLSFCFFSRQKVGRNCMRLAFLALREVVTLSSSSGYI